MTNFKRIASTVALVLLALLGWYGAAVLFEYSLEKSAIIRCLKLEARSDEFRESRVFYITESENKMCNEVDIHINAPIGAPELYR